MISLRASTVGYANDLKLIDLFEFSNVGSLELQKVLDLLMEWTENWSTNLNLNKCKAMYLGKRKEKAKYLLSNQNISHFLGEIAEEKDLGVFITNDLKWNKQCTEAAMKANPILGQIRNYFKNLNREPLRFLYTSLVRPHLKYAVGTWKKCNEERQN